MFRRDARRFAVRLGSTERAAARRGRAGGRELRHRPRAARRASSASPASRRTRSTPSPTATSCSTSWPPPRPARRTCRASAPRSCCGRARSSASARCPTPGRRAPRSCRRRRTRTPPSCCAPRRRASSRTWPALHGVHARPPADLQQGPAGGQGAPLRRRRHARAVPRGGDAGCSAGSRFDRERLAAAAADELIAATDVADLLVRRGMPFRQSHGIVAGLVREAVDAGPHAVRAHARGARAPLRGARRRVLRVLAQRSWLESKVSEGGTALAARARAARARARGARRPAGVSDSRAFYARPVLEVAPRAARLRRCATARRRA